MDKECEAITDLYRQLASLHGPLSEKGAHVVAL